MNVHPTTQSHCQTKPPEKMHKKQTATNAVVIYSKAPIEGEVKTRLAKDIGDSAALNVYQAMLTFICQTLSASNEWDCFLSASKSLDHPFFEDLVSQFGLQCELQVDGGLGNKMQATLETLQNQYDRVVIVGGDAVSITPQTVAALFDSLNTHDVGLVPALDGGYIAIGASSTHPDMFEGVDWGTDRVLSQQLACFRLIDWRYWLTEPLWDLDDLKDFERVKSDEMLYQKMRAAGLSEAI